MIEEFHLVYSLAGEVADKGFLSFREDYSTSPSLCTLLVHSCYIVSTVQANTALAENPEGMKSGDGWLSKQTTYLV